MNKAELITAIANNTDLTKAQAGTALDGLVNVVTSALTNGEKVTVLGFGTFSTAERAARVYGAGSVTDFSGLGRRAGGRAVGRVRAYPGLRTSTESVRGGATA